MNKAKSDRLPPVNWLNVYRDAWVLSLIVNGEEHPETKKTGAVYERLLNRHYRSMGLHELCTDTNNTKETQDR